MAVSKFMLDNRVLLLFLLVVLHGGRVVLCNKMYVTVTLNASQVEPSQIHVSAWQNGSRKMCILCYPGQDKMWYKLWINPKISISAPDAATSLDFYYGPNITEILKKTELSSLLNLSPFSLLKDEHTFDPFTNSCIGIASEKSYIVNFVVKNPEKWLVAYTVFGLLLFFLAAPLSRNTVLQYSTGISVGVLGSLLLVMIIIIKILPQKLKTLGYVMVTISTSASMYFYQWISYYFIDVVRDYWHILLAYLMVTGLLSFAVVYRYGPISNHRTLNLIKWTFQLMGLFMIYQGTQIVEVSTIIIMLAILVYLFPQTLFFIFAKSRRCQAFFRSHRFFRPKIQLLTEEEYYEEGEVETKRALEDLRKFCLSPECDTWRVVSRLTSPNKFANFIEGASHLSDMELENHSYFCVSDMNDDSESEIDISMTET